MYKISIIIPVYNAEDKIDRCINSILNQKWDGELLNDIEIILVDDCSTDNSKNIIDEYCKNYNNIKLYQTPKNSGYPSEPRNIGIKRSNATYLMFMDNDDEYHEDICKTLYGTIINENADIVSCNHYKEDEISKFGTKIPCNGENIIETEDKAIFNHLDGIFFTDIFIWNKIFKRDIIIKNNICYPSRHLEDEFFSINYYLHSNKLIYLKKYYGITKHAYDDSLGNSVDLDFVLNYIQGFQQLNDLIKSKIEIQNYSFRFNHVKKYVRVSIAKISFLESNMEIIMSLKELYNFEENLGFDNSLDEFSLKIINFFIIHKIWLISLILIRLMAFLRNSNNVRYIYRFLKF